MNKLIHILLFFFIVCFSKANTIDGLTAKFTFSNLDYGDAISNNKAKAYGVSFTNDRFGNSNSACYLQGDYGSYLNLGTTDNLKSKIGTISIWVKVVHPIEHGKGIESNPILVTRTNAGEDHNEAFYIGYDLTTKNLNVNTALSAEHHVTLYSSQKIPLRTWQHIVLTYDNNYLCFYLNGNLESKILKKFETTFLQGDSVIIGNIIRKKNVRFFNGCVDDIEFYNKVLNQAQITQLYNAPNPNKIAIIINWLLIIIAGLFIILVIIFLIKRRLNTLIKKEKEKNDLKNKALEFEIRMLKAQMDPHFVFNSLNAILQFIIIKDNDKAEVYLTKFSKLLRKLLESNTKEIISLEDEIDLLNKYLEIESLRFNTILNHQIIVSEVVIFKNRYIPHMLIQPFVENAIWHGLLNKEGEKKLIINFELLNEKTLLCTVDDNGVGRNKNKPNTQKDKSLALGFVKQRLDLMSKIYNCNYNLTIIDKVNSQGKSLGTKIELTLPIIQQ